MGWRSRREDEPETLCSTTSSLLARLWKRNLSISMEEPVWTTIEVQTSSGFAF